MLTPEPSNHARYGMVAAGHISTANAAAQILREGGNAFDAVIAAHFAACVAEPVLASLGGGGFLLARTSEGKEILYDFFTHTPFADARHTDLDFYPIQANFGKVIQEFHIGMGSVATPGAVKGLFKIGSELGSMPMSALLEPAIQMAKQGITINQFQGYIFHVVNPIFEATEEARKVYSDYTSPHHPIQAGDHLKLPELAQTFEALAYEGEPLFYQGEIAKKILEMCKDGGYLTQLDLDSYQVNKYKPLTTRYRNAVLVSNPPPSSGGSLILIALQLLESQLKTGLQFGDPSHLLGLIRVMEQTNSVRQYLDPEKIVPAAHDADQDTDHIRIQLHDLINRPSFTRGTTHISIIDRWQNVACMTVSNGEGCGRLAPGTGVMLNNMLGEQDLNPVGFNRWSSNQRISSMMAPSVLKSKDLGLIALGSGGSNRLRTAILQVLVNMLDFHLPLEEAVQLPRVHFENHTLNIEAGFTETSTQTLEKAYPSTKIWSEKNLFFGGVHCVQHLNGQFNGFGDLRRGGVAVAVD